MRLPYNMYGPLTPVDPWLNVTKPLKGDVPYSTRNKIPQESFEHLKEHDEHVGLYL